jgi:WD40 repeat protein
MIFDLIHDFASVLKAMPVDHLRRRIIKLLDEAIRSDAHFIAGHPTTLFQCLWNSCWWYDCPEAEQHYVTPIDGWPEPGPPWQNKKEKLYTMLEKWRKQIQRELHGKCWVRSLRPPPIHLGTSLRAVLRGHKSEIRAITYSHDGAFIVSGAEDGKARIWDSASTALIKEVTVHENELMCLACSADNRRIVSGSRDKTVRILDVETGAVSSVLRGHEGTVLCVAVSPDGGRIASGADDKTIVVWNTADGTTVTTFRGHVSEITCVAFSPDGQWIASGNGAKWAGSKVAEYEVFVWNAANGNLLLKLIGHSDTIQSVSWTPDGQKLLTASQDGTVRAWGASTGRDLGTILSTILTRDTLNRPVRVAISPDGGRIAAGYHKGMVRVWNSADGKPLCDLSGHVRWLECLAFSPDGMQIASAGLEDIVRVWDLSGGVRQLQLVDHEDVIWSVAYSPDGSQLASAGSLDPEIHLWDSASGMEVKRIRGDHQYIAGLAYSPDGRQLAIADYHKGVSVRDCQTGNRIIHVPRKTMELTACVVFSPDGRRMAAASGFYIRVWDAVSGREVATMEGHWGVVESVAFSPDGRLIASGAHDNTVRLWDAHTGTLYLTLEGHTELVTSLAFAPDGRSIVSRGFDNTIRIWDLVQAIQVKCLPGETDVAAVAAGFKRFPWRLITNRLETAILDGSTGTPVAWFPAALFRTATSLVRCTWAGSDGNHLHLFTLEGCPGSDQPCKDESSLTQGEAKSIRVARAPIGQKKESFARRVMKFLRMAANRPPKRIETSNKTLASSLPKRIERCNNHHWNDRLSFDVVEYSLKRIGFSHANDFWIPGNQESVVALFVNEQTLVMCQYHEKPGTLPVSLTLTSFYADGKSLNDHYHYASGYIARPEIPMCHAKHLADRNSRRPGVTVTGISVEDLVTIWNESLR